jgi:hypothetical protein
MVAEAEGQRAPDTGHDCKPHHEEEKHAHQKVPYYRRDVRNYMTSIPILLCCFCSGLVDSAVFNAWGVFATMQTGTVLSLSTPNWPSLTPQSP